MLVMGEELAGQGKYLADESRRSGYADALVLPRSTAEVCAAVRVAIARDWPITVSGARTGIAAGAVPEGGMLLSLERMNRICGLRKLDGGRLAVRCQAGVSLKELQSSLRRCKFSDESSWEQSSRELLSQLRESPCFFPPDPTETGASLGGVVACNASGAHTFRYGPARPYVQGLSVVLADGELLELERGQARADADGHFFRQRADGRRERGRVPRLSPPSTKNAAGYFGGPGMDLIDLFIGSEGTLGVIVEVEVGLLPQPGCASANLIFLPSEGAALDLTESLRSRRDELKLEAIEYFDAGSLRFLRTLRRDLGATSGVPECLPAAAECAIYLDVGAEDDELPGIVESLCRAVAAAGGNPELCWSAHEEDERERLRCFRHALPEAVNQRIAMIRRDHPGVTKLGTDMAVPDAQLRAVVALYREKLAEAGLEYLIFGHVGDNHLHVNILPETPEQYERGKRLYLEFARRVVEMGGSPAAEHGIGKLKREFLELLAGAGGVAEMRQLKRFLDPGNRLGRGTLFA